jgi:hypothetical protein
MTCTGASNCTCGCTGECAEPAAAILVRNPSGLPQIAYRVGTFATFRRALLAHLDGETELEPWRPTAGADLGLQVFDWWAYLADVLTFYNERIANENYLGTAQLDGSVHNLVALLGYRPRPGIGATTTLAVLAAKPDALVVPTGTPIASKAVPGVPSQTFETTATTTFAPPTSVRGPAPDGRAIAVDGPPASAGPGAADAPPNPLLLVRGGVLARGRPGGIAVGDRLLLVPRSYGSADDQCALATVTGLRPEKDPYGRTNTRVTLSGADSFASWAMAADYRLVRSTHSARLASMPPGANTITATTIVLEGPARSLVTGAPLLVEAPGSTLSTALVRLTDYAETLWYANAKESDPTSAGSVSTPPAIPIVVASLTVSSAAAVHLGSFANVFAKVLVSGAWSDVAELIATPVDTLTELPSTLTLAEQPAATPGVTRTALLADTHGVGALVAATPIAASAVLDVVTADPLTPPPTLQAPLRVLWDLVTVSRGASVPAEPLGSGDATVAGQEFVLAKSPVTYLTDEPGRSGDGRSGDGYSSTITLTVGDRVYTEVPSLYGHGPDEAVFETWEDESGRTHLRTGTGETGRRLPNGAPVVAGYRVGSGAAVPPAGALTQILRSVPNLRAVRNPVAPIGGADPEPAADVRDLAPRSVLTFGRSVSGDDYAAVAAAAPGVSRAEAVWAWDAGEQRPTVRVYVGDAAGAVQSARHALTAQADPNRPLVVLPAEANEAALALTVLLDPTYVVDPVLAAVTAALTGPQGLFAPGVLAIGNPLYRSRIEEVVLAVDGATAVPALALTYWSNHKPTTSSGPRFDPGDGGYFVLPVGALTLGAQPPDGADD